MLRSLSLVSFHSLDYWLSAPHREDLPRGERRMGRLTSRDRRWWRALCLLRALTTNRWVFSVPTAANQTSSSQASGCTRDYSPQ